MEQTTQQDLEMVRFRERTAVRGGALYAPNEQATFSRDTVEELVGSGVAVRVTPIPKAVDRPPIDKMIHGAPVKKGGR